MTPAAHPTADAPHERRRDDGARRSLISLRTLGLAALVLLAALSGVGGTYAMWNDQQTVDAGTLSAGTAELEASWSGDAPASDNLLPGESATRKAQLRNTGDVPMELSLAVTTDAPGFTLHAATTCDAAKSGAAIGADGVPLTAPDGAPVVLQPDESITACIAVTATPQLAPGIPMHYTLTLEGTQVR